MEIAYILQGTKKTHGTCFNGIGAQQIARPQKSGRMCGAETAREENVRRMAQPIWTLHRGTGPIVATAIHDGHQVRDDVALHLALDEAGRLREEDPFTGRWTAVAPTRLVGTRSRFEVDLNRPRDTAVYRTPDEAWGLTVWSGALPEDVVDRSLEEYDAFYAELGNLYGDLEKKHGRFLVLDLHSYNHRREGPDGPPADPNENPQINIGTGTMSDRSRWARLIDRFIGDLASYDFPGGKLDVRENVRFRGGACAAWTHRTFPDAACVLSIEVKKFFMDEWTGEEDPSLIEAIGLALGSALPGALEELER
jgi:N-formylglutamate deformylase